MLENLLKFPTPYIINVIGYNKPEFLEDIKIIVARYILNIDLNASISTRLSCNDKYLSINISVIINSKEQLICIYENIKKHKDVKLLL